MMPTQPPFWHTILFQKIIVRCCTDFFKRMFIDLIELADRWSNSAYMMKFVGHYDTGYISGNPEVHQSTIDPP